MNINLDKYRKIYDDMADLTGLEVVRLPDGMLGLRRVWEDWYIILKLAPDYKTLKLSWSVYDWGSIDDWVEYGWGEVYDWDDDDLAVWLSNRQKSQL
jgi:hypothetical protein